MNSDVSHVKMPL